MVPNDFTSRDCKCLGGTSNLGGIDRNSNTADSSTMLVLRRRFPIVVVCVPLPIAVAPVSTENTPRGVAPSPRIGRTAPPSHYRAQFTYAVATFVLGGSRFVSERRAQLDQVHIDILARSGERFIHSRHGRCLAQRHRGGVHNRRHVRSK